MLMCFLYIVQTDIKTQIVEMQLQVGQADGTSLCHKGIVKALLEINNKQFEHMFVVGQHLRQPLLFSMDFT